MKRVFRVFIRLVALLLCLMGARAFAQTSTASPDILRLTVEPDSRLTFYAYGDGSISVDYGGATKLEAQLPGKDRNLAKKYEVDVKGTEVVITGYLDGFISAARDKDGYLAVKGPITGVVAEDCGFLRELDVANNNISSIDLTGARQLRSLNFSKNSLMDYTPSPSTHLHRLLCAESGLKELDLSSYANLVELDCSGNDISQLDLSAIEHLIQLRASRTSVEQLTLPSPRMLVQVYIDETSVGALDLTGCKKLKYLKISGTMVEKLDCTDCEALEVVWASNSIFSSESLNAFYCSLPTPTGKYKNLHLAKGMMDTNESSVLNSSGKIATDKGWNILYDDETPSPIVTTGTETCKAGTPMCTYIGMKSNPEECDLEVTCDGHWVQPGEQVAEGATIVLYATAKPGWEVVKPDPYSGDMAYFVTNAMQADVFGEKWKVSGDFQVTVFCRKVATEFTVGTIAHEGEGAKEFVITEKDPHGSDLWNGAKGSLKTDYILKLTAIDEQHEGKEVRVTADGATETIPVALGAEPNVYIAPWKAKRATTYSFVGVFAQKSAMPTKVATVSYRMEGEGGKAFSIAEVISGKTVGVNTTLNLSLVAEPAHALASLQVTPKGGTTEAIPFTTAGQNYTATYEIQAEGEYDIVATFEKMLMFTCERAVIQGEGGSAAAPAEDDAEWSDLRVAPAEYPLGRDYVFIMVPKDEQHRGKEVKITVDGDTRTFPVKLGEDPYVHIPCWYTKWRPWKAGHYSFVAVFEANSSTPTQATVTYSMAGEGGLAFSIENVAAGSNVPVGKVLEMHLKADAESMLQKLEVTVDGATSAIPFHPATVADEYSASYALRDSKAYSIVATFAKKPASATIVYRAEGEGCETFSVQEVESGKTVPVNSQVTLYLVAKPGFELKRLVNTVDGGNETELTAVASGLRYVLKVPIAKAATYTFVATFGRVEAPKATIVYKTKGEGAKSFTIAGVQSEGKVPVNSKLKLKLEAKEGYYLKLLVVSKDGGQVTQLEFQKEKGGYSAVYEVTEPKVYVFVAGFEKMASPTDVQLERGLLAGVECYPNPVQQCLTLALPEAGCRYAVRNMQGIAMLSGRASGAAVVLDLGRMPAGVYLVQVTAPDGRSATRRVVKL